MKDNSYLGNRYNSTIELKKLCNSIAKISCIDSKTYSHQYATGMFIKLTIEEQEIPFFCTVNFALKDDITEVILTLNQKDEHDENIVMKLNLNHSLKRIITDSLYSVIFIEILEEEMPENITLNFLELEIKNLSDPFQYFDSSAILVGYPRKYLDEKENGPTISCGKIIKIEEENDLMKVVYNMKTDYGSSGSPICILDEKNKLKLIAIHIGHELKEKSNYNTGNLLGPIIKKISNVTKIINVNTKDERKSVQNINRVIFDKFDMIQKKDFLKDNFIILENYHNISFYHKQIVKEYNNQNYSRFFAYYNLLKNYILSDTNHKLHFLANTFLYLLRNFKDIQSTYNIIKEFNNELITNFNYILLSDDYNLKTKTIFFISTYIQTLKDMNCTYKNRDISFYQRSIMNLDTLIKLKSKTNQIVMNQYFMKNIIPITRLGSMYKFYYDLKKSLWIDYSNGLSQIHPSDYDTRIFIDQKIENNSQEVNIFKISYCPELVIAPFSFFKVNNVEINHYSHTAVINLTLVEKK